jgi:hypothetical protein
MQIHTLFAGFLAATLTVGLPTLNQAEAADRPAKTQKAQKKAKKPVKPAAPAAAAAPAPAPAAAPAAAAPAAGIGGAVAGAAAVGAVGAAAVAGTPADSGQKAALDKAIADAQTARKKASSVGGEWRDTGKMVKQAEEAGAAGDYAKGLKLASEAQKQGELGYEQAMKEKGAGFPDYMKKP